MKSTLQSITAGLLLASPLLAADDFRFVKATVENTTLADRIVAGNVDIAEAVGNKGALQKTEVLASTQVADIWFASEPVH